jgi:hypothetical protein
MQENNPAVNAWLFLDEDHPDGTNYNSPNSCYQTLIKNKVYPAVDMLFFCFVGTAPTSAQTIPAGDGSSYTITMSSVLHNNGGTDTEYMQLIMRDARKDNPNIKFAVTLAYGDPDYISNIFKNKNYPPGENAARFAANLVAFLKFYNLDGFDIDWEYSVSDTDPALMTLLLNAIGTEFRRQTGKHLYLTLSPNTANNLEGASVNANVDFLNLQLYGGADPQEFTSLGINYDLLAYGILTETGEATQTAQEAYDENKANYNFKIFTNWRLNSGNFPFEQTQQKELYKLVFP